MRPKLYKVVIEKEVIARSARDAVETFFYRVEQAKDREDIAEAGDQLEWEEIGLAVFPVDVSDWEEEEEDY